MKKKKGKKTTTRNTNIIQIFICIYIYIYIYIWVYILYTCKSHNQRTPFNFFINGKHPIYFSFLKPFIDIPFVKTIRCIHFQFLHPVQQLETPLTFTNIFCYPFYCKKFIPYSYALRLNRICSNNEFFYKRCNDLEKYLLETGYSEKMLRKDIL